MSGHSNGKTHDLGGCALQVAGERSEPAPLSYRFFERYSSDSLQRVQRTVQTVIDDRTRQFDLFTPPDPAPVEEVLGERWSPSQLSCLLTCQAKWWARYGLRLPETRNSSLALGTAVHAAVSVFFKCRLENQDTPNAEELGDLARAAMEDQLDGAQGEVLLDEDESREELAAAAGLLARLYLPVAETIQPKAVDLRVEGEIGGVKVGGFIDLMDSESHIIDLKTSRRSASKVSAHYAYQLATYTTLHPQADPVARLDTLVRLKREPKLVTLTHDTSSDVQAIATLYPQARRVVQQGLFLPNRESNMCSRRYCPYWAWCEKEWGGHVDTAGGVRS